MLENHPILTTQSIFCVCTAEQLSSANRFFDRSLLFAFSMNLFPMMQLKEPHQKQGMAVARPYCGAHLCAGGCQKKLGMLCNSQLHN